MASSSGNFTLFLSGPRATGVFPLYTSGPVGSSGNIPLYVFGKTYQEMPLFIRGPGQSIEEQTSLHTHGESVGSGIPYAVFPLYTTNNWESTSDNRTLFIQQNLNPSGLITLYSKGGNPGKGQKLKLFIQQGAGPNHQTKLFTSGRGLAAFPFIGKNSLGWFAKGTERSLFIARSSESTATSTRLFVSGTGAGGDVPLVLVNNANYIPLFIDTGDPASGLFDLYTAGPLTHSSGIPLSCSF